ncbi:MAG: hypothetical protein GX584_11125 [Clostridiaceae bacterium]|jgi:hypothetical protein|nr:hypothetical protein [Clostridiaceae bacterium]
MKSKNIKRIEQEWKGNNKMKSKYIKNTSLLIVLVILLSYSIIPVSASSDYYESTHNGYYYNCDSNLYPYGGVFSQMYYAGTNKICIEIEYSYYDFQFDYPYQGNVISPLKTSTTCTASSGNEYQLYLWSNNIYTITPNIVYSVGLS